MDAKGFPIAETRAKFANEITTRSGISSRRRLTRYALNYFSLYQYIMFQVPTIAPSTG